MPHRGTATTAGPRSETNPITGCLNVTRLTGLDIGDDGLVHGSRQAKALDLIRRPTDRRPTQARATARETITPLQYSGMSLPSPRTNAGDSPSNVPPAMVRGHVAHILRTPGFAKSERLKRFLSFAVERFLAGDPDNLKEYVIALEVFDRKPDYNPKIDAVVRVEARRLRSRLEQYYATEGIHDPIRIQFPRVRMCHWLSRLRRRPSRNRSFEHSGYASVGGCSPVVSP
jgi:hypothetical protein